MIILSSRVLLPSVTYSQGQTILVIIGREYIIPDGERKLSLPISRFYAAAYLFRRCVTRL